MLSLLSDYTLHEAVELHTAERKIAPRTIERGIFLRALTADEFLAQVHNNLGFVYSQPLRNTRWH
jgi:hypothetical protein